MSDERGKYPAGTVEGDEARYGFRWGPFVVARLAHIEGRGYALEIRSDHGAVLQVLVSEKGRKITPYPMPRRKPVRAGEL